MQDQGRQDDGKHRFRVAKDGHRLSRKKIENNVF